jgi:hypothetical protein
MKRHAFLISMLLLAACGREQTNSDGNGPGNADGAGGREDPPTAPATSSDGAPSASATDSSQPSSGENRQQ